MSPLPSRVAFVVSAAALALAALWLGYLAGEYRRISAPPPVAEAPPPPPDVVGQPRPDFALPDLEGRIHRAAEWDGTVLVVNFWATWCPPCLEEIPLFNRLQAEYRDAGVRFLGIAIDEVPAIRAFQERVALGYPTLHGGLGAIDLARSFGNRSSALPFTALVGTEGRVRWTHAGALKEPDARRLIEAGRSPK